MNEVRLKAFASVTFDDSFAVRNMKIVKGDGDKGLFLCMPSRKMPDGTYKDMVHPVNQHFRDYLEEHIMKAYRNSLKERATDAEQVSAPQTEPAQVAQLQ